jgi:hypothetical protein
VAVENLQEAGTLFPAFSLYNGDDRLRLNPACTYTARRGVGGAALAGVVATMTSATLLCEHMLAPSANSAAVAREGALALASPRRYD